MDDSSPKRPKKEFEDGEEKGKRKIHAFILVWGVFNALHDDNILLKEIFESLSICLFKFSAILSLPECVVNVLLPQSASLLKLYDDLNENPFALHE